MRLRSRFSTDHSLQPVEGVLERGLVVIAPSFIARLSTPLRLTRYFRFVRELAGVTSTWVPSASRLIWAPATRRF
jgi:hypothetical protein